MEREAGRYGGGRKYGRSANVPPTSPSRGEVAGPRPAGGGGGAAGSETAAYGPLGKDLSDEGTRIKKPNLDEMGPGTDPEVPLTSQAPWRERPAARSTQGLAGQRPKYKGRKGR